MSPFVRSFVVVVLSGFHELLLEFPTFLMDEYDVLNHLELVSLCSCDCEQEFRVDFNQCRKFVPPGGLGRVG